MHRRTPASTLDVSTIRSVAEVAAARESLANAARWATALVAVGLLAVVFPGPVEAATIAVAAPGGVGVVAVAPDDQCSLREALVNADTDASTHADCPAGSGADTLVLPPGAVFSVLDAENGNGLPLLSTNITIQGNEATIWRDPAATAMFRLFSVAPAGSLTLVDVTITGGRVAGSGDGGAIYNRGTTIVRRSTITGNSSGGDGGAIESDLGSDLEITSSTISGNAAGRRGGGIESRGSLRIGSSTLGSNAAGSDGGAITSYGSAIISDTTVTHNYASDDGGGIESNAGATVTISNSTIVGNSAYNDGGAISSYGSVSIADSTLSNNTAGDNGGAIAGNGDATLEITSSALHGNSADVDGGAIYNEGTAIVTRSTMSGNSAGDDGGGIAGGGIAGGVGSILVITNSMLNVNSAGNDGGAINIRFGTATVTDSTLSGNSAGDDGGGIVCGGHIETPTITIASSTISGNTARGDGGGIYIYGGDATSITNSTISGNSAGHNGGGFSNGSGSATIVNCTISDNQAVNSGQGVSNAGNTLVVNTIVSGRTAGANCSNQLTSGGHNIESGDMCGFTAPGDQRRVGRAALNLGPLQDNGGLTLTRLPGPGSVAIGAGDDAACAAAPVSGVDQRGAVRPQPGGTTCDIGAVEAGFVVLPTPTPTVVPPTSTPVAPVCWQIVDRVPRAAIDAALADPGQVAGHNQPHDPGKPLGPYNPRRTWLTLHNLALPYHTLYNSLVYKAWCP